MDPVTFARQLRRDATTEEKLLWNALRRKTLGVRFRRQQPLGHFVVDFYCHEARLAVELDGGQHADRPRDEWRDDWLRARGYEVVRYWNHEVREDLDAVVRDVARRVAAGRGPSPGSA